MYSPWRARNANGYTNGYVSGQGQGYSHEYTSPGTRETAPRQIPRPAPAVIQQPPVLPRTTKRRYLDEEDEFHTAPNSPAKNDVDEFPDPTLDNANWTLDPTQPPVSG